jgi:hypothetical protein
MSKPREQQHGAPLAHSPDGAARVLGIGKTLLFSEIKNGRLKAKKIGRRTAILDEDLRDYAVNLPQRSISNATEV